jgi:hypothetical protein
MQKPIDNLAGYHFKTGVTAMYKKGGLTNQVRPPFVIKKWD